MRIVLVDPAAYTIPYDHALAAALARAGAEVELLTSRFRFGRAVKPDGYRRRDLFYPLTSRTQSRSRLRLPLRGAEHLIGLARLGAVSADVLHVHWSTMPQLDVHLLPLRRPSVMTAHDILPRRTAARIDLWRRMYSRFDRVIAHSESGRRRLVEQVGLDEGRIAMIPHPVFPGTPRYEDDGATLLSFGVVRPYKQLDHALDVARETGARLIVAGAAAMDVSSWCEQPNVEWRLSYLNEPEIENALAESTVALFPYRQELDQSGALLRALGSGVPVIAYDVGGLAEPVRRFDAGIVVDPDDRAGLAEAVRRFLGDPETLERARAGARKAAAELTWEASAASHLALYRELAR